MSSEDKKGFIVYVDYEQHLKLLTDEENGKLFMALIKYASCGELPDFDGALKMAFSFMRMQLDRDNEKYENVKKARSEAGKLGGRPKNEEKAKKANVFLEKQNNQNEAKKADTVTDTVKVKETDTDIDKDKEIDTVTEKETNTDTESNYYKYEDELCDNKALQYYKKYISKEPDKDVINTINYYISKGMTDDCILEILKYCHFYNKTAWRYIKAVISGNYKDGVRTKEDYAECREKFSSDKEKKKQPVKSNFHNFDQREYSNTELDDLYFEEISRDTRTAEEIEENIKKLLKEQNSQKESIEDFYRDFDL